MYVKDIDLKSFRNFDSCQIEFDPGVNVFYGKNGVGKTNLLEAIFVLLLARSPRGAGDSIMLTDTDEFYRIVGNVELSGKKIELAVAYQIGGRKKITIDKVASKASDLFNQFTAVSAAPEDVELLSGPPSKRRDFINIYLSQASQKYISDLGDYQKALAQKNAFLKQDNNSGNTPYDDLLVSLGTEVIMARQEFLDNIGESTALHYHKISDGQILRLDYKPSVDITSGGTRSEIEDNFRAKLKRYHDRERIIQTSMVGPHRDDVDIFIRDYPARTHASQGEIRSAAISMKLAVFDYLSKVRRIKPVLLLDEIFAELDSGRKHMLVELFDRFGQIFITAATQIPDTLQENARVFRIENGLLF